MICDMQIAQWLEVKTETKEKKGMEKKYE